MRRPLLALLPVVVALAALLAPASAHALAACNKYASTAGNDVFYEGNSPQQAYRTVNRLVNALNPGQTGCVIGPATFSENVTFGRSGTASSPITVRSEDPDQRATLAGGIVIPPTTHDVVITGMTVDSSSFSGIGIEVGGDRISFVGNELRNDTLPCIYAGNRDRAELASGLLVEGNRIHQCESGVALNNTEGARVVHNTVYDNLQRGILMYPNADGSTVEHNVVASNADDNVQFGGNATGDSDDNKVLRNVITNTGTESSDYNLGENYEDGSTGTGNEALQNCLDGPGGRIQNPHPNFSAPAGANLVVGDPGYQSLMADDYTLTPGSACAGRGPFPTAFTGPATVSGARSATLTGEINPHFQPAYYSFEYGPGFARHTEERAFGPASVPTPIESSFLTDLQPGTTYSYRLVSRNPSGSRHVGATRTFTTQALPDADGDGVPDEADVCDGTPRGPVDNNGDGCPDDSDGDGVADATDACDTIGRGPIDRNGDGCPDDSDGDGRIDTDDRCPNLHRGDFDTNDNGCPGPMPTVDARAAAANWRTFARGRRVTALRLTQVRVRSVERGATVRLSCKGCKGKRTRRVRRAGLVKFTRNFPSKTSLRTVITLRVTKRGEAGRHFQLRWNARQRAIVARERCIPIGSSKPASLKTCGERTS